MADRSDIQAFIAENEPLLAAMAERMQNMHLVAPGEPVFATVPLCASLHGDFGDVYGALQPISETNGMSLILDDAIVGAIRNQQPAVQQDELAGLIDSHADTLQAMSEVEGVKSRGEYTRLNIEAAEAAGLADGMQALQDAGLLRLSANGRQYVIDIPEIAAHIHALPGPQAALNAQAIDDLLTGLNNVENPTLTVDQNTATFTRPNVDPLCDAAVTRLEAAGIITVEGDSITSTHSRIVASIAGKIQSREQTTTLMQEHEALTAQPDPLAEALKEHRAPTLRTPLAEMDAATLKPEVNAAMPETPGVTK